MSWMRVLSRTVTEISEDPTRAYRLDLELSPIVSPLCIHCQNTVIETSNRDAISGWRSLGLADARGTTWAYVATNPEHSPNALTSPWTPGVDPINALFTWRLAVNGGVVDSGCGTSIGTPGSESIMVNLSPLPGSQGANPPGFSAVPAQTGTFTIPLSIPIPITHIGFTVTADYGGGPLTVNEGYSVCLTRIG